MLLHPIGTDHPGNAARSEYHGLGVIGDRKNDSAAISESHIDQLLADERYETSLDDMASLVAPADGDPNLAQTVDALLRRVKIVSDE